MAAICDDKDKLEKLPQHRVQQHNYAYISDTTSSSTTTPSTFTILHNTSCASPIILFLHESEQKHAQRQSRHCGAPGRLQLKHRFLTNIPIP